MSRSQRPFICLNYATTADGKISTADGRRFSFGSHRDRDRMDNLRSQADAVLIGGGTLRAENPLLEVSDPARRRARLDRGQKEQPRRVVLSRSLDLPLDGPFFAGEGDLPLVLTGPRLPRGAGARLKGRAEIIRAGDEDNVLGGYMAALWSRGIRRLLVEGGGEVNEAFLRAGLVDEIYMTICPLIVGGRQAPSPVGGEGFPPPEILGLELLETYRGGDEIFCRYRVRRDELPPEEAT
jgi:riboflavin-specific deaminase-like protein